MLGVQKKYFISYHRADLYWAEWIAWQLEEAGFSTSLRVWDSHAGQNAVLDTHRETIESAHTIAVFSEDYLNDATAQSEWTAAFIRSPNGEQRPLIPVRVRPCELKGLLGPIISIDLIGQEENNARRLLLNGVVPTGRKPQQSPPFPGTRSAVDSASKIGPPSRPPVKALFPKDLPPITKAIEVFAAYAPEDQKLWEGIEKHLALLKQRGLITTWQSGQILLGREISSETRKYWEAAQVILLLVSANLFSTSFNIIEQAMSRHTAGIAHVIPILMRSVDWQDSPFAQLRVLPENQVPVTNWRSSDDALTNVALGIRKVVEEILLKP